MANCIEEMIFEESASNELLELVGRKEFDWAAQRMRAIDNRINAGKIDGEAFDHLDTLFPIIDLELALDYLYKFAVIGNDQELKKWVTKQKERVRESRNKS